ncbi:MAG: hypothetical protein WEB57_00600 [Pseudohongiellaceae bacterium]
MSEKINFIKASTHPSEEQKALDELCHYLVSMGKYHTLNEAKADAIARVGYFERLGLYKEEPSLEAASLERKSVHALIYGHDLHELIESGRGYLPEASGIGGFDEDPAKRLYSLIETEIRNGSTREEVAAKLESVGMTKDQAISAYYVVQGRVRNEKLRIGMLTVIAIALALFIFF